MPNLIPHKPSAAMLVAVTALVSSFAGPAVADEVAQIAQSITSSKQIKNGSVTGADVKNNSLTTTDLLDGSVQSADIGTGQVDTSELAPNSVRGDKIPSNTIDGSDIQDGSIDGRDLELSTLGEVPSATRADIADNARTLVKIDARLEPGQSKTVATVGAIALTAQCRDDAGTRYVELLASTTAANAYMDGEDTLDGGTTAAEFLQPSTPAEDRQLFEDSTSTGDTTPELDNDIDQAWIVGPSGEYIGVDGETLAIGHNALGGKCTLIGNAVAIG